MCCSLAAAFPFVMNNSGIEHFVAIWIERDLMLNVVDVKQKRFVVLHLLFDLAFQGLQIVGFVQFDLRLHVLKNKHSCWITLCSRNESIIRLKRKA